MERRMTATEARVHFGEMIRRVVEEETPVVVERGGVPRVVVLSIGEYERLRNGQGARPDWRELVERSRALARRDLAGRPLPPPEDMLREAREIRDQQLLGERYRRESGDTAGD